MKEILIVEDSSLTRLMVRRALEEEGYRVAESASGEEALARLKIRAHPFSLIILDINLPGMDGIATLEALRKNPDYAYVPVMMLTVTAHASAVKRALALGAVDYLCKPFEMAELVHRVKKLIGPGAKEEKTPLALFGEVMRQEINRAQRGGTPLSLVLGYREREAAEGLEEVAAALRKELRSIDTVIPLTRSSLVVVLPVTNLEGAGVVAEKLTRLLARYDRGAPWTFAAAGFPEHGRTGEELLEHARMVLGERRK